jgi:hypothetical protein
MSYRNCSRSTFSIACAALLSIGISSTSCAAEGRIAVRVLDADGQVTPIRAWVDAADQRLFEPISPDTATPYGKDSSFSCDGEFTMVVPAGDAVVHIEKGKEFLPVDVEIQIAADETVEKTIRIERWIDMPEAGWYSADLHVHLGHDDPRVLQQLALADDVHLIPSFTYWLRGQGETWHAQWPDGTFNRPIVIDDSHLITRNNIEIERINREAAPGATIGATFLFNLNRPVTAVRYGEHFPTDAELCRVARTRSPAAVFDSDKPSWAETVVGAAFGMLDTVQVCHNHYARLSTGLGGYGMIGPLAPGESNAAVGDGLFHRTNELYYRFLNCGFPLGVSGGSAIGVKAMPTGHHRVYARIEGPLTAEKMWAAIKAGRTFATTGPIMTLNVNGEEIGATISIDSAATRPVKIRTMVRAIEDLESIEIVHNGHVVASRDLTKQTRDVMMEADLDFEVTPKRSGWIASRVLYRAPDGLLRQAHTSPIYISIDDQRTASAPDARYMLRWLDQLTNIANEHPDRFPDASAQKAVLITYAAARSLYQQIINDAVRDWGD